MIVKYIRISAFFVLALVMAAMEINDKYYSAELECEARNTFNVEAIKADGKRAITIDTKGIDKIYIDLEGMNGELSIETDCPQTWKL
jgi:hypothetical protein